MNKDNVLQKIAQFKAITQKYAITPQVLGELLECIASIDIDLSPYAQKTEIPTAQSAYNGGGIGKNKFVFSNGIDSMMGISCVKTKLAQSAGNLVLRHYFWNAENVSTYIDNSVPTATTSAAGAMSSSDKSKLNNVPTPANILVRPSSVTALTDVNSPTEGFGRVGASTSNLPSSFDSGSKWGVVVTLYENGDNGTGTQLLFPIDGTYKGSMWVRSVNNLTYGGGGYGTYSSWKRVVLSDELEALASRVEALEAK